LFDFNEQLRESICHLLDIYPDISYSSCYVINSKNNVKDLRESIHPKKEPYSADFKTYYQVFESKYGFRPNLSIIDLLFNMGPEAILFL
jgi:hypothetical protein